MTTRSKLPASLFKFGMSSSKNNEGQSNAPRSNLDVKIALNNIHL
jgi:hypothetical protein